MSNSTTARTKANRIRAPPMLLVCWVGEYYLVHTNTPKERAMAAQIKSEFIERVRQALSAGIIVGDGHSIYSPEFYAPYFTVAELRKAGLIDEHKSDYTSHKSTLFDGSGKRVAGIKGVYNLYFLEWLNGQLGTGKWSDKLGRGSQARDYVSFIASAVE
jgi:hypothetical protein